MGLWTELEREREAEKGGGGEGREREREKMSPRRSVHYAHMTRAILLIG